MEYCEITVVTVLLQGMTLEAKVQQTCNSEYKLYNVLRDNERWYILTHVQMLNKLLTLANVYHLSNGDHPDFFFSF